MGEDHQLDCNKMNGNQRALTGTNFTGQKTARY